MSVKTLSLEELRAKAYMLSVETESLVKSLTIARLDDEKLIQLKQLSEEIYDKCSDYLYENNKEQREELSELMRAYKNLLPMISVPPKSVQVHRKADLTVKATALSEIFE